MDNWFTHAPLIGEVLAHGLDVIGMIKNDNKRFLVQGQKLSLNELYAEAAPVESKQRGILRLIRTELAFGIPVQVVFVRHRTKKKEWLAILTTMLRKLMTKKFRDLKKLKSSGAGNSSLFFQVMHIRMKLECSTSQIKMLRRYT